MITDSFERLEILCRDFYQKNRRKIVSIVLAGSAALEPQQSRTIHDVDIFLVCHSYNLVLRRRFHKFLKPYFSSLEIHAGIFPLARMKREKSLFMYDVKHKGRILAGEDIRSIIPAIEPKDLFPYEGFRLLLNRTIDLIKSRGNVTQERIDFQLNPPLRISDRIMRAYVDSYLIFNNRYHPDPAEKIRLFRRLQKSFPKARTFKECSETLLTALEYGIRKANFNSIDEALQTMEACYKYPLSFRIYTAFRMKKFSAFFRNPIFEAYRDAYCFLANGVVSNRNWQGFASNLSHTLEMSPQPMIVK